MAQVSLPRVKQNQAITGDTIINTPATALEAAVNGNLEETNLGVNAPIKLVTTLSGESVRAGKICLLQAGNSRLLVTYDSTLGKWVSDPVAWMDQQEAATTTNTSFETIVVNTMPKMLIPNFKLIYDAGLRPQFSLWSKIDPVGAITGSMRVAIFEFTDGDTAVSSIGNSQTLSHATDTATYKYSDWATATIGTPPTDPHGYLETQISSSTAAGVTFTESSVQMRWRST